MLIFPINNIQRSHKMYSSDGKSFSFFQFKNIKKQPQSTLHQFINHTSPNSIPQYLDSSHMIILFKQIDYSINLLKQKTISLVQTLRKHSLNRVLQTQLQNYLTDVLDQMDLLTSSKQTCFGQKSQLNIQKQSYSFSQIVKPKGDDQCFHLEDTQREPFSQHLKEIQEISNENTQVHLQSKIQTILRQLQLNNDNQVGLIKKAVGKESKQGYSAAKNQLKIEQKQEISEQRFKNEQKYQRFSNSYIRDITRPKKGKLI